MAVVEPAIRDTLDRLYERYLAHIEGCLRQMGFSTPHADALVLMATQEGLGLFIGHRAKWEADAAHSIAALRSMLIARYPMLKGG